MIGKKPITMLFACVLVAGLCCLVLSSCNRDDYVISDLYEVGESPHEPPSNSKMINDIGGAIVEAAERGDEGPKYNEDAEDNPKSYVKLEWIGLSSEQAVESNKLCLRVTNISDLDLNIRLAIECAGLLGQQGQINLEGFTLEHGDKEDFTVPSSDLPIQNIGGASKIIAVAKISGETPSGSLMDIAASEQLFYRFCNNYETSTFFSRKVLMEEFKGCLGGLCTGNSDLNQVLGRMRNENGEFVEISLADYAPTTAPNGVIVGHAMGMSIGGDDEADALENLE